MPIKKSKFKIRKIIKVDPKKDIRDLARFNHIMLVLTKHGFGHLLDKLPIKTPRRFIHRKAHPERLRRAFEELGPTFVKLGQILSLRPDLVPKEYVRELGELQDNVPPFPYEQVEEIIKKELKKPINEVFKTFSKEPIASASISQVHKATLHNGKIVAVKVQRPTVRTIMETDIEVMFYVAKILEKHSKKLKEFKPTRIVGEFKRWTEQELNFKIEAKNAKRFYKNFQGSNIVKIPKVYDNYTTKKILTLEFIDGIELHNIKRIKRNKEYNINKIIKNGFDSALTQVFIHGFFHADPHPGNILVLKGNKIGLVDFGIVGHFNKYLKHKSMELFYGLVEEDMDSIVDTFLDMGLVNEKQTDIDSFKEEVKKLIEPLQRSSLKDVEISKVLEDVLDLALKHHVKLPLDFVLFGKTILEIEGVGLQYAPKFKLVENSKPFLEKLISKEFKISNMAKNMLKSLAKYSKFFKEFPDQITSALRKIQQGTIKVDVEDTDIKRLATDIDKSSNRVTYGMLIAAFLITGALLVNVGNPILYGFTIASLICFALALIFAVILFVSIEKEEK